MMKLWKRQRQQHQEEKNKNDKDSNMTKSLALIHKRSSGSMETVSLSTNGKNDNDDQNIVNVNRNRNDSSWVYDFGSQLSLSLSSMSIEAKPNRMLKMEKATLHMMDEVHLIPTGDCEVISLLGSGTFCNVYKARIKQQNNTNNESDADNRYYALKGLNERCQHNLKAASNLMTETAILSSLPTHDNIVKFYGIAMSPNEQQQQQQLCERFYMVIEHVPTTLEYQLDTWRCEQVAASLGSFQTGHNKHLLKSAILERIRTIGMGIVNGMQHLARHGIVHRDLKPANIGIDNCTGMVKIFDFGFARYVDDKNAWSHESSGTLRYLAPEAVLKQEQLENYDIGLPLDVYSFAMVLWEICSLTIPFPKIHDEKIFKSKVYIGQKRPNTRSYNQSLRELFHSCWAHEPCQRPTFDMVHSKLQRILIQHNNNQVSTKRKKTNRSFFL